MPVTYTTDGQWSAKPPGSEIKGHWKIVDGRTLCTTTTTDPTETCAVYPDGKKSGEEFDVSGAMGPALGVVKVRIN